MEIPALPRLDAESPFPSKMSFSLIDPGFAHQNIRQIDVGLRVIRIKAEREAILFFRFIIPAQLLQNRFRNCSADRAPIQEVRATRGNRPGRLHPIYYEPDPPRKSAASIKTNTSRPFRSMQEPTRKKGCLGRVSPAGQTEGLARRFLAHLPDKAIVIKSGAGQTPSYHTSRDSFYCLDLEMGGEITKRAVRKETNPI